MRKAAPTVEFSSELERWRRRWEREHSARLEAESIAEDGLRELHDRTAQLGLLGEVAIAANESTSAESALRFAIARICQITGWPWGHAYLVQEETRRLVEAGIWHGTELRSMGSLQCSISRSKFDLGAGLPRQALEKGTAAWIADLSEGSEGLPEAETARRAGIKARYAFPVLSGNEVVAVLEFFSDVSAEPDEDFVHLMELVGAQLGRVLERRRNEDRLIYDASHDPLTKLPNRALFLDRLRGAVARYRRHPAAAFAVLFIDLDRFKVVNDSLGHNVGDRLIVEAGGRLSSSLRTEDMVSRAQLPKMVELETLARLGGDEFTVLLEDIADLHDAVRVAERMQRALEQPFLIGEHRIYISASIGIAWSATNYATAEEVIRDADLAMYRAKASGKARYEIYDQNMYASAVSRLSLENQLRHALEHRQFVLHYQPIVALDSRQMVGVEALVRWRHPEHGLLNPGEFISLAEDTGLILPLGEWILEEACRTMHGWHRQFPSSRALSISVNVSARQFGQADFAQQVQGIIAATGIAPEAVRLEITESVSMMDVDRTVRVLSQLREWGVRFSVDDFGTGFSSLSYLHRLPLDVLKIDRSFILRMAQDHESQAIVQTIVSLAQGLGMEVVAEGAETEEHVTKLQALRCEFGQGFFFARPLEPQTLEALLQGAQLHLGPEAMRGDDRTAQHG